MFRKPGRSSMRLDPFRRKHPFENACRRSGHQHMFVFTPSDLDLAAIQFKNPGALHRAAPHSVHQNGTGGRARCKGYPDAAFPDPNPGTAWSEDLDELDICPLGKERVMFDLTATGRQVHILEVVNEERAMRVAHRAGRRRAIDRQIRGVDRLRKRDRLPIEDRGAHIDLDLAVGSALAGQCAALGAKCERVCRGLAHDLVGNAPCRVAACRRERAIRVPENQLGVGVSVVPDLGELIKADTPVPVRDRGHQFDRQLRRRSALVDDNEVVAKSVHFFKAEWLCHEAAPFQAVADIEPVFPKFQWAAVNSKLSDLRNHPRGAVPEVSLHRGVILKGQDPYQGSSRRCAYQARRGRRSAYAGMAAEDMALRRYAEGAATLLARRWRCAWGEIDLVLLCGDVLVFVEVKQRRKNRPLEAPITPYQWQRLVDAANTYIFEYQRETGVAPTCRFDVALVGHDGSVEIIENARSMLD